MAIAGLGEVTGFLKAGVAKHTNELMSAFMTAIDDSAVDVCSNAIYGLGLLLEGNPQNLSRFSISYISLTAANITPSCISCNASSQTMPLQTQKRTQ